MKKYLLLLHEDIEKMQQLSLKEMAKMYIETAEFKVPTLGDGIVKMTRAEIISKYSELNGMFTDIHDKVIKTYPSGEKNIIVEFISSGTAPDNSKFELRFA